MAVRFLRPAHVAMGTNEASQFLHNRLLDMLRFYDRAGSFRDLRLTPPSVLPSEYANVVGILIALISRFHGWPIVSPVNASAQASRPAPHDSGARVIRYFFSASNFHRLPIASLLALSGATLIRPTVDDANHTRDG